MLVTALAAITPPVARAAEPYPADLQLLVRGGGWGHGHGMGQYGARAQAEEGRSWRTILRSYYSDVAIEGRGNPKMRVLIDARRNVVVGGPETYEARWGNGAIIRARTDQDPFTRVRATDAGVRVSKGPSVDGPWDTVATGSGHVWFTPVDGSILPVALNGRLEYYRDAVQAYRRSGSTMYAINELRMDRYLYGVVPREMPASWHGRALRAQAVAARTYSLWKRSNASSAASYHICATTMCQVYRGYGYRTSPSSPMIVLEHPLTNGAIDATSGNVMTAGGAPIFAEFHSSSGGYTGQGSQPYLAPRPDPWDEEYSPYHRWETTVKASAIERAWPSIGRLSAITGVRRNGFGAWGGRVESMKLVGTDGSATVSGASFRYALGLRSDLFKIYVYAADLETAPEEVVIDAGASHQIVVTLRNTGTISWPVGDTVRLGTYSPANRTSAFEDPSWISSTRVTGVTADLSDGNARVAPGQLAEFRFTLTAPPDIASGTYDEVFRLRAGDATWFGPSITISMRVAFAGAAHLGGNLIGNPSFEAAADGSPAGWTLVRGDPALDRLDATHAVDEDAALMLTGATGSRSSYRARIERSGAAGDRYVFSGWNRSEGTSTSGGTIDAVVRLRHLDGSMTVKKVSFPLRPHRWTFRQARVSAPQAYDAIDVTVSLRNQTGKAWFDDLRLTPQALPNASFESGKPVPSGWRLVRARADDGRDSTLARAGWRSLRLSGRPAQKVAAVRSVAISGATGETWRIGGWSATKGSSVSGGGVQVLAVVHHTDGTRARTVIHFPRSEHPWLYGEAVFTTAAPFGRIDVMVRFMRQTGTAWFDDLVLTPPAARESLSGNPGFELGSPTPGEWTLVRLTGQATASAAASGDAALTIPGDPAKNRYARQSLPLGGEAGDVFRLSGWNRTVGSDPDGGPVRVWARVRYTDGTRGSFIIEFARGEHAWRRKETLVTVGKPYEQINLFTRYSRQTGTAYFDDVVLEPVST